MAKRLIEDLLDSIKKELEAISQEFSQHEVRLGPFAERLPLTNDLQEIAILDRETGRIIEYVTRIQTKTPYSYLERKDLEDLLGYRIAPRL